MKALLSCLLIVIVIVIDRSFSFSSDFLNSCIVYRVFFAFFAFFVSIYIFIILFTYNSLSTLFHTADVSADSSLYYQHSI
jgi:hypothetical protein